LRRGNAKKIRGKGKEEEERMNQHHGFVKDRDTFLCIFFCHTNFYRLHLSLFFTHMTNNIIIDNHHRER